MSLSKFAARRRGFTLIELLIVIVVIAILSLIVIPKLMGASRKAKDSTLKANLHLIRNAIESFQADTGMYPATLGDLCVAEAAAVGETPAVAAQGFKPGTTTVVDVPTGTYKGPYLRADGPCILGTDGKSTGIPVNPYAQETEGLGVHWAYDTTGATGVVKPGTIIAADATDAEGKAYSNY